MGVVGGNSSVNNYLREKAISCYCYSLKKMKNTKCLCAIICMILTTHAMGQDTTSSTAQAQDNTHTPLPRITFGIAVGPNFTTAASTTYNPAQPSKGQYTSSSYSVGFDASMFALLWMGKSVYLRPGLGFSLLNQRQQYCNYSNPNDELSTTYRDKLTETQISVSALLGFLTKPFDIEMGPQVGIVTSAVTNSVQRTLAYNGPFLQSFQTNFKKGKAAKTTVFSLLLGLSKMNIYNKFGAGIYYSLGFSDYTQFYKLWQINQVSGFLIKLTMKL
jgi:hypothetical protein